MQQITLCTCPDQQSAEDIANHLVTNNLAACVNIIAGIRSIYQWQGKIESAQEQLLIIKSNSDTYPRLEVEIKKLHPYELPEIITVPIERGLPEYLQWIDKCVSTK